MQKTKTTPGARRAAQRLALAALAAPTIALVGAAAPARTAPQEETPSVALVTRAGADEANAFAEALVAWKLESLSGEASTQALKKLRLQIQRAVQEAPEDAALADVLVDVEEAWVARIAVAGEASEREAALASLAAAVSLAERDGEADPLTSARARAAERPGVAALLAERAAARGANEPLTPAQTDVALSRAIDTALASGDMGFIGGLGSLAVDPLRQLALSSNGSPRPSGALSPLQALLDVDVRAGLDVADTLVGSGDLLLKREVAAAINAASAFDDDAAWTVRPGEPDVIRDTAWLAIPLQLVAEPSVSPDSVRGMLNDMAQRAALPESLWDLALATDVRAGRGKWNHPAMSGYFERALASDDTKMVDQAIRYFTGQSDASPLYSIVASPIGPREIRRAWMAFGPREYGAWIPGREHTETARSFPEIDDGYVDAFRRMLAAHPDQTQSILRMAGQVTAEDPTQTLPVSVLRDAAKITRESELQNWATPLWYLVECEGDAERDLATALIRDLIDANVETQMIGEALEVLASEKAEPATYWAAREVVDARVTASATLDRYRIGSSLMVLYREPDKLDRVVDFMETVAADPERASALEGRGFASSLTYFLARHAPERAIEILTRVAAWPDVDALYAIQNSRRSSEFTDELERDICVAMLASKRTTAANREMACRLLHSKDVVLDDARAIENALVDVIARGEPIGGSRVMFDRIGVHWPRVIAGLLDRDGAPADQILPLRIFDMDAELAERVLRRFPASSITEGVPHDLVEGAAVTVLKSDVPGRVETLSPYVEASDEVAEQILRSFAYNPDPATLPLVREAAARTSLGDDWFERLAGAISGLMTDESAALLLDLGRRPDLAPEKRRAAMEQFETMLQWREAAARWERSSGAVARRDEAIAKLVELLDGDQATEAQRVQAIRGLGLLGAAEELPRLIGLLDDVQLRAAAQEAIDALHSGDDDGE